MSTDPRDADETPLDPFDQMLVDCLRAKPEARDRAVTEACRAFPERSAEIRERLALLEQAGMLAAATDELEIPEQLGDFRLLARLGGGGMGVVHLALQQSLGREVALKLIRPEQLYFPGARERFRREVEAVASLQHPGIIQIYTVGEEGGVPFFAMERVGGSTLAELLCDLAATPAERLVGRHLEEVFASAPGMEEPSCWRRQSWTATCFAIIEQVAEALQHAHDRDILHRDVKPSNIMLSADGRARLLDFGLASVGHESKLTRTGSQVGSLAYMSPEQLRGDPLDARTDVYSLGVTLYEMLTLCEPYMSDSTEALRLSILHGTPRAPRLHNRQVPWDAETVCLVAMDADRERRYTSAAAFAADLRRFLDHQPIRARRPSLLLRGRRYVQRHPTATVAMGLGMLLVAGIPSVMYWQESQDKLVVTEERDTANEVAQFLVDLFSQVDPEVSLGRTVTAKELLELGLRRIEAGDKVNPRIRSRLLQAMAQTNFGLGLRDQAEELLRRVIALQKTDPEVAWEEHIHTRTLLGTVLRILGEFPAAEQELVETLELARAELGEDHPATAHCLSALGVLCNELGRAQEAESSLRQALTLRREIHSGDHLEVATSATALGAMLIDAGQLQEGKELSLEALGMLERLGEAQSPNAAAAHHQLAIILRTEGDFEAAHQAFEQALQLDEQIYGAEHPELAHELEDFGGLQLSMGHYTAAEETLTRALRIRKQSFDSAHPGLARSFNQLSCLFNDLSQFAKAEEALRGAIAIYRRAYPQGHRDLAIAIANLAFAQRSQGLLGQAEATGRKALAMCAELGPGSESTLVHCMGTLAVTLNQRGRHAEAVEQAHQAVELTRGSLPEEQLERAKCLDHLAYILLLQGQGAKAEQYAVEAMELCDRIQPQGSARQALVIYHRAWAHEQLGDIAAAEEVYRRSLAMYRQFVPGGNALMAWALNAVGVCVAHGQRWEEAQGLFEEALRIRAALLPESDPLLSVSMCNFGTALLRQGEWAQAEVPLSRSLELRRAHPPSDELETSYSLGRLGIALIELDRAGEAVALLDECLAIRERRLPPGHFLVTRVHRDLDRARRSAKRR